MITSEEIIIKAPTLVPYVDLGVRGCPACGLKGVPFLQRLKGRLFGGGSSSLFKVHYCAGGKEPTERIESPVERAISGRDETSNECGGILQPHLHLRCNCCGFAVLSKTKVG